MIQQVVSIPPRPSSAADPALRSSVPAQLAEAERLLAEEQKAAAIAILESILQRNACDPLAGCLLAQLAVENGQIAQARSLLKGASRHGKARIRARIRCIEAEIQRRQKLDELALSGFEAILALHPTGGIDDGTAIMALLGTAHIRYAAEDLDGTEECLEEVRKLAPENFARYRLLTQVQYKRRDYAGAAVSLGKVLAKNTSDPALFASFGVVLALLKRRDEAAQALRIAIRLQPTNIGALKGLANLLYQMSEPDEIPELMRQVLALDPTDAVAAHTLAAVAGGGMPERASDSYIRKVFDDFAGEFDRQLVDQLRYVTPQLLGDRMASVLAAPARQYAVLDAGCGTGLCGAFLRGYAERLIGVDLSVNMLKKAAERRLYDDLVESELVAFLDRHPAGFDVIAAADVFVYFGAMTAAFESAARALRPGGVYAISVERLDGGADYKLNPHGRYSHSEAYLRRLAGSVGLEIAQLDTVVLRHEVGQPVHGMIALFVKPGGG
jgi:predicted TPR repeat methyltransferase